MGDDGHTRPINLDERRAHLREVSVVIEQTQPRHSERRRHVQARLVRLLGPGGVREIASVVTTFGRYS